MTTSDIIAFWALAVSLVSAVIASLSLGWNIYRDVILKPKVVVTCSVVFILHDSLPERPQYINIMAINHGPGTVTISGIYARTTSWLRRLRKKSRAAFINTDHANPMSQRLPAKLEPGDKVELLLPYTKDCVLGHEFEQIGVADYFGRMHWASSKSVKQARKEWSKDFGAAPTPLQ